MVNSPQTQKNEEDGLQVSPSQMNFFEWVTQIPIVKLLGVKSVFLIPIIMVIIMSVGFYFVRRQNDEIMAYNFNGRVDSVWYDGNRNDLIVTKPYVSIHGKTYYLYYHAWGFERNIQPGDSMIKLENTFTVTLIKKSGKKFVYEGD